MRRTTLCYIENNGKYLMLHRNKKKDDPNAGKWLGIGGGIEQDETPDQCLLREALEETGLTLTKYQKRGLVHFRSDCYPDEEMYLYTCTAFTGAETLCDEGDLEWIAKEDLLALPLWEGDLIFLKLIGNPKTPYFELTLQYKGDMLEDHKLVFTEEQL